MSRRLSDTKKPDTRRPVQDSTPHGVSGEESRDQNKNTMKSPFTQQVKQGLTHLENEIKSKKQAVTDQKDNQLKAIRWRARTLTDAVGRWKEELDRQVTEEANKQLDAVDKEDRRFQTQIGSMPPPQPDGQQNGRALIRQMAARLSLAADEVAYEPANITFVPGETDEDGLKTIIAELFGEINVKREENMSNNNVYE